MGEGEFLEQPNGLDSRRKNSPAVLKGLFYVAIAIAIIAFLVIETINAVQVMTGKTSAKANVISTNDEVREWNDGNDAGWVTVAVYRFNVMGHEYYGKTEVSQGSLSEGDQLTIKYNSKDPTKNRVIGDRAILGRLFTFLIFGGWAVYMLIGTSIGKLKSLKHEESMY